MTESVTHIMMEETRFSCFNIERREGHELLIIMVMSLMYYKILRRLDLRESDQVVLMNG